MKDVLRAMDDTKRPKLLVAEFDYIPLYFPVYYAYESGIFDRHGIDVEFLSTKGDAETYFTLTNNSAQIGLSDPLFSMMQHESGVHGKLIGEFINKLPLVAISINPSVRIQELEDFKKYII